MKADAPVIGCREEAFLGEGCGILCNVCIWLVGLLGKPRAATQDTVQASDRNLCSL